MSEMFCPKCSQQQFSEDVRFCSRCGFQMEVVARLLETNGSLIGLETGEGDKSTLFRRITSNTGSKVMFVSFVLFIFTFILAAAADADELLLFPFFLFVIGLAMLVYNLIFGGKTPSNAEKFPDYQKSLKSAYSQGNLPPAQSVPVSAYENPRRRNTNETVPPPSVTEPTTKLLEPNPADTKDL